MWLLLGPDGRSSREFDSFATFRTYWKHRLAKLRGATVKGFTPLVFDVREFQSDKSAGQTEVEADFVVQVRPRGEDATLLQEARVKTTFVKGPDRMWYLNIGTLPEAEAPPRGRK